MANNFDKVMDDCYSGREIKGDPGLEYLQGYGYAESLCETDLREQEQVDDRVQEDPRQQEYDDWCKDQLNNQ